MPTFGKDCKSLMDIGQPNGYYIFQNNGQFVIGNCSNQNDNQNNLYPVSNDPFMVAFEVHRNYEITNNQSLFISNATKYSKNLGSITTTSWPNDFEIPDGKYQITSSFKTEFPIEITINDQPIPNAFVNIEQQNSKDISWTLKCHSPSQMCYKYVSESKSFSYVDWNYNSRSSRTGNVVIHRPVCDKPKCNLLCTKSAPCIIQIRKVE